MIHISEVIPDVMASIDAWFEYEGEDEMRFVMPLPPNRANQRKHWKAALREKKNYWDQLNVLAVTRQLPQPPERAPHFVRIESTLYVWAMMDVDNSFGRLKYVLDWLKGWGYIADDSPKHLALDTPKQIIDRKNQRLEIEIRAA